MGKKGEKYLQPCMHTLTRFPVYFQEDKRFFRFSFQDKDIPYRNLADLALWRDDKLFTDQRLAGSNPMAIQRISWDPGNPQCKPLIPVAPPDKTAHEGMEQRYNWRGKIKKNILVDIY